MEGPLSPLQRALLRNPVRRGLLREVGDVPGINKNQLGNAIALQYNGVDFHVERLEEASLLAVKPSGRGNERLCFLPRDEHLGEPESTRILFGREATRNVALYIVSNPGARTRQSGDALDLSRSTVRHHLSKLEARVLVERIRLGRQVDYHPTRELEAWVEEVGDAFDTTGSPRARSSTEDRSRIASVTPSRGRQTSERLPRRWGSADPMLGRTSSDREKNLR